MVGDGVVLVVALVVEGARHWDQSEAMEQA
jgi:hypothetical protein